MKNRGKRDATELERDKHTTRRDQNNGSNHETVRAIYVYSERVHLCRDH